MALEALIDCAYWHVSMGDFSSGDAKLQRAYAVTRRLSPPLPHQQAALPLLEAHCRANVPTEFHAIRRHFETALQLCTNYALAGPMIEATVGLMYYHALIGREDDMYDRAEDALNIARSTDGSIYIANVAIWIGTTLVKSRRYWRAVSPLIFEVEPFSLPGTIHWALLKGTQAEYFVRSGKYEEARVCSEAAVSATRSLGNPRLEALVVRDLAATLKVLGCKRQSIEAMERAVELAEVYGSAQTL